MLCITLKEGKVSYLGGHWQRVRCGVVPRESFQTAPPTAPPRASHLRLGSSSLRLRTPSPPSPSVPWFSATPHVTPVFLELSPNADYVSYVILSLNAYNISENEVCLVDQLYSGEISSERGGQSGIASGGQSADSRPGLLSSPALTTELP